MSFCARLLSRRSSTLLRVLGENCRSKNSALRSSRAASSAAISLAGSATRDCARALSIASRSFLKALSSRLNSCFNEPRCCIVARLGARGCGSRGGVACCSVSLANVGGGEGFFVASARARLDFSVVRLLGRRVGVCEFAAMCCWILLCVGRRRVGRVLSLSMAASMIARIIAKERVMAPKSNRSDLGFMVKFAATVGKFVAPPILGAGHQGR